MMLKSTLRKQALQQRKNLSKEELLMLNQKLLEQFKKLDLSAIKTLHLFLPIAQHNEPDTFMIINWLQIHHPELNIIVPKADFTTHTLQHYYYNESTDLVNNAYHIPEPQHAKPFIGAPDMVILPLLAFDLKGYRVGYGKGFYDRFLQGMKTQKIGLSFFEPTAEIIDVHLNDIKLDQCITPNGIIDFRIK